jgi:hypothetical protein
MTMLGEDIRVLNKESGEAPDIALFILSKIEE